MHDGRDSEAAEKVDDERPVRKGATETLRRPEGYKVAGTSTGGAGQADPEESFHVASPRGAAA
jgi:hypothetical protein